MNSERNCHRCFARLEKSRHVATKYCAPCAKERNKETSARYRERRKGAASPLLCSVCGMVRAAVRPTVCMNCQRLGAVKMAKARAKNLSMASRARSIVKAAKESGLLPALTGGIKCVDCEAPATEYDHRDYTYPLFVQPVCRSCNSVRGAAAPYAGERIIALHSEVCGRK